MITNTAKQFLAPAQTPEQAAEWVQEHHWDMKLPVDPVIVANSLGVKIYFDDTLTISGQYTKAEGDRPVIYINPRESLERQRFTAFHELGHFVLKHDPSPRDPYQAYNQYNFDPKESAANKFAAEMIMPRRAVEFFVKEKSLSLNELADVFAVSLTAMRIRLENLGLIRAVAW